MKSRSIENGVGGLFAKSMGKASVGDSPSITQSFSFSRSFAVSQDPKY